MIIKDYSGQEYIVTTSRNPVGYYSIYIPYDTWHIKVKYDLMVIYGGMRLYINKDGSIPHGYNQFKKGDLKRVYNFFKDNVDTKIITRFSNPLGEKTA